MAGAVIMGAPNYRTDLFGTQTHGPAERLSPAERPALTEYENFYCELTEEIRDVLPTLAMMEPFGTSDEDDSTCSTARTPARQTMPERLGDYRILREIGRGGMGVVYEAEQESLGRHVALKVLSYRRRLGAIQLMRFQREAKAAAGLHHTNIVPVFGVGAQDGVHYYAMQYIHGRGLDSVLEAVSRLRFDAVCEPTIPQFETDEFSTSLATGLWNDRCCSGIPGALVIANERHYYRRVARLGMQAAEAIAHAHERGIIHRDIKPANLVLDAQGTIWVTDFGLAKDEQAESLTNPGDVVGTLRYMAPERFQGKTDHRSDIYSLGLSLYEMLTLSPAFPTHRRLELVSAIIEDEPERPRELDPRIPRDLETIVLKAISKNPADRFSSAAEMARELGRFVASRPIRSRRVSAAERAWRWSRRNPAAAVLSVLVAVLSTVLALGSTSAGWSFREQRDAIQSEERNAQVELARLLVLQGRALRYSKQPGRRDRGLEVLARAARIAEDGPAPPDLLEDLREEVIAALGKIEERPVGTWPGLSLKSRNVSFASSAGRYMVREAGRTLRVRRVERANGGAVWEL
jgi:serine/threonine protein kinase